MRGSIPFTGKLFFLFICFLESRPDNNKEVEKGLITVDSSEDRVGENPEVEDYQLTLLNSFREDALNLIKNSKEDNVVNPTILTGDSELMLIDEEILNSNFINLSFLNYSNIDKNIISSNITDDDNIKFTLIDESLLKLVLTNKVVPDSILDEEIYLNFTLSNSDWCILSVNEDELLNIDLLIDIESEYINDEELTLDFKITYENFYYMVDTNEKFLNIFNINKDLPPIEIITEESLISNFPRAIIWYLFLSDVSFLIYILRGARPGDCVPDWNIVPSIEYGCSRYKKLKIIWLVFLLGLRIKRVSNFFLLSKKPHSLSFNNTQFRYLFLILERIPQQDSLFYSFFLYYQNLYLNELLKFPCQIKNYNASDFLSKELMCVLMYNFRSIRWWKYEIKHSNQLIELILISIQLKNLNLVMKWIKSYFEKRVLKKHKKLFIFLKYLFLILIWRFQLYFNIRGVRLYFKGKIGKAGSVRKSKKIVQRGRVSYSTKSLALVSEKIVMRTLTGTLGLTLELFF